MGSQGYRAGKNKRPSYLSLTAGEWGGRKKEIKFAGGTRTRVRRDVCPTEKKGEEKSRKEGESQNARGSPMGRVQPGGRQVSGGKNHRERNDDTAKDDTESKPESGGRAEHKTDELLSNEQGGLPV